MFCSIIIATIARPSLQRSVQSVLEQELSSGEYEVVVVNDTGKPLPKESWQDSRNVRIITTNRREKSAARNAGAAIATGEYLFFLDDDDFLLPGALAVLQEMSEDKQAVLYYGGSILTDRKGKFLINLKLDLPGNCFVQLIAGEWIPLGSYIIRAQSFFEVAGFNPLMTMGEDSDLCRRLALIGDFVGTQRLVLQAEVGSVGSTANYQLLSTQSRAARELILDDPHAYHRMLGSATSSYWHGRIVRAYLTSSLWNLRRRKVFVATSRILFSLRAGLRAGRYVLNLDYWISIIKPHQSRFFMITDK
jgi:glycosyltransferase involved in cell wall biosynthesis